MSLLNVQRLSVAFGDAIVVNDDLEKAWVEFKAFCAPEESK